MTKKADEGDKRLGNEFWKLRSKHGRDKIFETPELLWKACQDYFEQISEVTLDEQNWVGKDGDEVTKKHPVPFTLSGLYVFLGINRITWGEYRKRKDFTTVTSRVDDIIYTQQFSYAATGFFNPNIIARNLGLTDKKDLSSSDGTMVPKPTIIVSDEKAAEELKKLIDGKN